MGLRSWPLQMEIEQRLLNKCQESWLGPRLRDFLDVLLNIKTGLKTKTTRTGPVARLLSIGDKLTIMHFTSEVNRSRPRSRDG